MLRDLLVRASAGLLGAAIAISCTREGDKPREDVGSLRQAASLAGAGGADSGVAGASADLGGAPPLGVGGADTEPETCDPAVCEGPNSCTRCVGNQCVRYTAADNHQCRAADASGCDVADFCDGSSDTCGDAVAPSTTQCGTATGACDADDFCDGTTKVCADAKRPDTFVCRVAAPTGCDVADRCDGVTSACPDVVSPSTTKCRDADGPCDVDDFCSGTSPVCADAKQPSGVVCRPDVGTGCDVADVCDGTSNACPDVIAASTQQCRQAGGDCDVPDFCNGLNTVCADSRRPSGFVCRPKNGDCDVQDACDGASVACPADAVLGVGTVCRAKQRDCDVPETCQGAAACPADGFQPDGAACADAANKCFTDLTCTSGQCGGVTPKTCPAAEQCKTNTCTPATGNCQLGNKPNAESCSDSIDCTVNDQCQAGSCVGTPNNARCAKSEHLCASYTCDPGADAAEFPDYCRMTPFVATRQCRPAGGVCGIAELCDGKTEDCPADLHRDASSVCQPSSCVGALAKPQIRCNGGALCPAQSDVTCVQYACDAATKTCGLTCADDAGCQPDHYCVDGTCEKRIDPGGTCTDDTQCSKSNPHCVDGVCCNTVCQDQCEACDIEGQEGTCSPVTGAPHGARTACRGDGSSCSGACNGTRRGDCDYPAPGVECLAASCDPKTSTALEQAFCDGTGNCAKLDPIDCTPYSCGATACRGNCVSDAQCAKDAYCRAGICEERQEPGEKCARDGQCASGFCTDGVCCEGRCDGQCEACGKTGKCEAVTGAPVGARPACAGASGDACAGACDGALRVTCSYPAGEVSCRDAGCEAGKATVVAHCTGVGSCAPEQTVACPNGCEGTICAGDACLINSDCREGERCIAGTCAPQGEDGAACGSAGDCDSGFCVDGVCCNRACDGQCEACDGAKKPGVCAPVSGAPHGSRVQCTSDGSACGGACDGTNAEGCSYPAGTACGAGSCTPGEDGVEAVATVEAQCNGSGRCPAPRQQACGGAGCDAEQKLCNGDCADGSACPAGQYCSAGVCVATQPTGTACQAASDCASGFCVDGYCCGSACDDRCAACDVPGALGTCAPVSGNTHGGRPGCQGGGVCGALCDGKNVTDCAFADARTACGDGYCSSGTQVAASACDGAGQCQPGEQVACASFSCDGAECSDVCTTDADCTRSLQCREGKCTQPYKIDAVDEGTCGCRAPGNQRSDHGAAWGALGLAAVLSWRRRRARAA